MIRCINCGCENSYDSTKCKNCQCDLYHVSEEKRIMICRFCHSEIPHGEKICKFCGNHIIHGRQQHEGPISDKIRKLRRRDARFGVVFMILAGILFLLDAYSMLVDMSFFINFVTRMPFQLNVVLQLTVTLLSLSCLALGIMCIIGLVKRKNEEITDRMIYFGYMYLAQLFVTFFINTLLTFSISMMCFAALIIGLPAPILLLAGSFKVQSSRRRFYY